MPSDSDRWAFLEADLLANTAGNCWYLHAAVTFVALNTYLNGLAGLDHVVPIQAGRRVGVRASDSRIPAIG
jgi:hypothetical protein